MDQPTRSYTWGDPRQFREPSRRLSGLEFMRLVAGGELGAPPMMATLGMHLTTVDEGYIEFECDPGEFLYNPMGVVHGGLAATLLDSAASCAVHTTVPAGSSSTTLDLSLHLLRPISSDLGTIRAVGTVLNRGRRTALGNAELRDGSDRLLAHATASCMVFTEDA